MNVSLAHRRIGAALIAAAGVEGAEVAASTIRPWSSITFSGHRHRYELALPGQSAWPAAKRLSGGLDEAEFDLPGWCVADIAMIACKRTDAGAAITIEALTVSDG